ncbi:MAG TPA: flagellar hook-length control protein FliK [Steroidobacteraceae bacterium]|nr:flagellar hook-length control protein FliK [Steroidobacteraceae bacterium]
MNAVPPVLQAQPASGPVQPNPSDSAASAPPRAGSQDFASALNDAGGRPARKNAATKHQDSAVNGSSLPPPGNQPPPAQSSAPPAKSAAAAVADAPVAANGPPGSAQGSAPNGVASASTTQPNPTDAATILTAENFDTAAAAAAAAAAAEAQAPAAPPALEALPSLAAPPAHAQGADATTPSAANAPSVPASALTMPHVAGTRILATPGTSKAPTVPAAPAGNAAKLGVGTTSPGTTASANSTTSSSDAGALTDSTSSSGTAAAGTDAAVQAAMSAAIAQGTNATAPDSTFADDLAASDSDLPSGAAAVSGPAGGALVAGGAPAAGASAAALAQASAAAVSAAVTAASAASVAQAISATAGAGAADKRSHGNSPDSTLSGASNDGSVGAAQLLTSNAPTDSAPTPTFKVAAGVDTAQFGQGVADRVSVMMDGNLTSAKLQVNPPALGPIEVRIALQGGHAQVSFSSHSAVTRDALESSSEKLREMLGSQGFSSVSVDISHRSFQERSPPSQAYESASPVGGDASVLAQAPRSMARSASGLLDAYA